MTLNLPAVPPARTPEEVDRRIELWHTLPDEEHEALGEPGLEEYLGWTYEQYWLWFKDGTIPNE